MVEVQIGEISGRFTLSQMGQMISSIDTLILGLVESGSILQPPVPYSKMHAMTWSQQSVPSLDMNSNRLCPNSEDLKYKMVRISLNEVDLCLVESNTLINVNLIPIKMATCNVHSCRTSTGVTGLFEKNLIPTVHFKR